MTAHSVVEAPAEGELLWTPSAERIESTVLTGYTRWLAAARNLSFGDYHELWRWSVSDLDGFWRSIWDYFEITASVAPRTILGRREMPGAEWFLGARLNYAENVLRRERPGEPALLFASETEPVQALPWSEFAGQVRALATAMRAWGVGPGDRVACWLPNVPQAMIAMLATTAVGAVWASCSPDFGAPGALDRFAQLEPTVLFAAGSYRHGGKEFDRRTELAELVAGLPGLRHVVDVPARTSALDLGPLTRLSTSWDEALSGPPVPADGFRFEQVPFDHPLWVLFSSGTTGPPKALVHGHGGILLEQVKLQSFHLDLRPGDRVFFHTTTGWMMWNFLATTPAVGAVPVLYDGHPAHPQADTLWRIAQDSRATLMGASPSFVEIMIRAGIAPRERFDLSGLRTVMPAGSTVSPKVTAWFYRAVATDVWVATGSGGTDCCTGFVGGVPTLPVYAGEIQAPSLGVAAQAFDEQGTSVVDQVGELVITQPLPSMPVRLWGDPDGRRYRDTYLSAYPGVWRHGDLFRINARGGCFVLGRSDGTLNRHGVRIGSAEIYAGLEGIAEIQDALVVNLDLPEGGFFMPLFVALRPGLELDAALEQRIRDALRRRYSPRHVPDQVIQVPGIPVTRTGKRLEVPVRRVLMGVPMDQAVNRSALNNPEALDAILDMARQNAFPSAVTIPRRQPDPHP